MKKIFFIFIFGAILLPAFAAAQIKDDALYKDQLKAGGIGAGLTTEEGADNPIDPRVLVGEIIKIILQVLGTVFVVLLVLSGYRLIKADGDSGKIDQAKQTMQKAIVGLLIILASYSIANFITQKAVQSIKDAGPKTGFDVQ